MRLGVQIAESEQRFALQIPAGPFFIKMLKLIYTADLHGNEEFYKRLLKKAEDEQCGAVVIGGDLCPKGGDSAEETVQNQREFIEKFMLPLFKKFKEKNKKTEIKLMNKV